MHFLATRISPEQEGTCSMGYGRHTEWCLSGSPTLHANQSEQHLVRNICGLTGTVVY